MAQREVRGRPVSPFSKRNTKYRPLENLIQPKQGSWFIVLIKYLIPGGLTEKESKTNQ